MIAGAREDGGRRPLDARTDIHKAMKRALGHDNELAIVVQAETGGGWHWWQGGVDPSIIALHAPRRWCLNAHRPVRMMMTVTRTSAPPRSGIRRSSAIARASMRLASSLLQIEAIMDGGAYCTLTPVVLSRGILHAGGPIGARTCGSPVARWRPTPNGGASRGFGAPQTEFAAEMLLAASRRRSTSMRMMLGSTREGDTTPTGQVLRELVAGIDVLEAAAEAS